MNENVNYLAPVSEASAEDRSKEGLINSSFQLLPNTNCRYGQRCCLQTNG
jgi:hypothetical protein